MSGNKVVMFLDISIDRKMLRSPTKDLSISNTSYFFCNFSTSSRESPENLEMSSGENLGS